MFYGYPKKSQNVRINPRSMNSLYPYFLKKFLKPFPSLNSRKIRTMQPRAPRFSHLVLPLLYERAGNGHSRACKDLAFWRLDKKKTDKGAEWKFLPAFSLVSHPLLRPSGEARGERRANEVRGIERGR